MNSVIPCPNPKGCNWPACPLDCQWRPGTDILERLGHVRWCEECTCLPLQWEAKDEIERLRAALREIEEWSRAYPKTVFPEPDLKRAHKLLQAGGMTLDAISAHAMRHVVESVANIARCALGDPAPPDVARPLPFDIE